MLLRLFGGPSSSRSSSSPSLLSVFLLLSALGALPARAGDVLQTNGFSSCLGRNGSKEMNVERMNVKYDRSTSKVTFDVAGTSTKQQNVTAILTAKAYGREVYRKEFNPCEQGIKQLCPVPAGRFAANDQLEIPEQYKGAIPGIAFQIPDLDGIARLELKTLDGKQDLACLTSVVENGKTASVKEAKYVTAAMAAAALALSALSAAAGASAGSSSAGPSPTFAECMFWFQGIAMDGMLSVQYPKVYRSFTDNFAWSTGLISWDGMQRSIDQFRKSTGGNLDTMSIDYLLNSTLVFENIDEDANKGKRSLENLVHLMPRDINASVNGTAANGTKSEDTKIMRSVKGIQAKVEELKIPSANTFMTVLLIFCIVLASVAVAILLFKVILEAWALFGSFPKSLRGFRKRYWGFLLTTIVRIILILYSTWTLYCLYQFRNGDSWGAHVLAGVTLTVFTLILGFFAFRIISVAHRARRAEGGSEQLFLHKPYLRKYGLFYDQFKSNLWWVFVPLIVYAFCKGAFIALGDGHGLVQTVGQLACEVVLLVLLLWNRPYNTRAGNVLNIIISCVRVLSVVCLIVFVEQLGIAADTKTVTGVALIAIQSTLTAVLAICLVVNAIIVMCKENPHTKKRKELEKQRETDLTPLDARNSMLAAPFSKDPKGQYSPAPTHDPYYSGDAAAQGNFPLHHMTPAPQHTVHNRGESTSSRLSRQGLVGSAMPMASTQGPSPGVEQYRGAQQPPTHTVYEEYRSPARAY